MSEPNSAAPALQLLSIVLPARDEEGCIASTIEHLHVELRLQNIPHEIVVVDDGSSDRTWLILEELKARIPTLAPTKNTGPHGFGRAIIWGLNQMQGDAVVIMMADESDDVRDVVRYWRLLNEGYDCVFGSRFMKGGGVIDYPRFKLFLNRIANAFLQVLFAIKHNDTIAPNRDLLALGASNIVSALFLGMPVGAGYSATSANEAAGASSRLSGDCPFDGSSSHHASLCPVTAATQLRPDKSFALDGRCGSGMFATGPSTGEQP